MGRSSLILPLLCAVVFHAYASPYSKIPDSIRHGDDFTSLSSQSGSFSHANKGNLALNGIENGRAVVGTQTSAYSNKGVSHSESSSYSSSASVRSAVPIAFVSSSVQPTNAQFGYGSHSGIASQQGNTRVAGGQFWWMAPGSPFLREGEHSGGCSSNGCQVIAGSSGGHERDVYTRNEAAGANIQTHVNPFLGTVASSTNGGGASGVDTSSLASSASFASANRASAGSLNSLRGGEVYSRNEAAEGKIETHVNPFLGTVASASKTGGASGFDTSNLASSASFASANRASGGSFNSLYGGVGIRNGGNNPFFNGGVANGGSSFGYGSSMDTRTKLASASGSSLNSASGGTSAYGRAPQQSQSVSQIQANARDEQQQAGGIQSSQYPGLYLTPKEEQEDASLSVTCEGEDRICVHNSQCSLDGYVIGNGILQVRSLPQECDLNDQVCCTLRQSAEETRGGIDQVIFGAGNLGGISGVASNGYLPPIGSAPSSDVPAFTNPPKDEEPDKDGGSSSPVSSSIIPAAPAPPPQIGCAAALLCVEEQFCSLGGVITTEPLSFTSEQLIRRVPLSSCKNPDNGVIGKCCRDPNYVDPWPAGNLPANYSGGFDEQGFPKILNIPKSQPARKRPYNDDAFKSPSTIKTSFSAANYSPKTITTPVKAVQAPYEGAVKSSVPFVPVKTSNPPVRINYDVSSSNQDSTVIVPRLPLGHCGVRNLVQRPTGLSDVDVAFGEIPWQAMVLSTVDRKLLCSGVIVAANAVVTAASCVQEFKAGDIAIKTGEWKLGYELKHEEPLPFEIINVASIVSHPAFIKYGVGNDIAILFLEHDAKFDRHVNPICLSDGQTFSPQSDRRCIATGWGKIVLQVNVAGALMHAIDVDVLGNQQCRQRIADAETQILLDESLLCGKARRGNNNMCQVDFGGPLACERADGSYELTGIYTQETGCLPTNQVATFAKIPSRWIQETIANPPAPGTKQHLPVGSTEQSGFVHRHGPNEPCNCHELLAAGTAQYLPPV